MGIDDNSIVLTARSVTRTCCLEKSPFHSGCDTGSENWIKYMKNSRKLADRKKDIHDDDILVLAGADRSGNHRIKLEYLQVTSE